MIARIWYGWTNRENAEKYEKLLREEVLLEIAKRSIPGYKGAEIFTREGENDEWSSSPCSVSKRSTP
jgi:hypothetical protein